MWNHVKWKEVGVNLKGQKVFVEESITKKKKWKWKWNKGKRWVAKKRTRKFFFTFTSFKIDRQVSQPLLFFCITLFPLLWWSHSHRIKLDTCVLRFTNSSFLFIFVSYAYYCILVSTPMCRSNDVKGNKVSQ